MQPCLYVTCTRYIVDVGLIPNLKASDGLFLILNDEAQRICQDMLKLKTVTFEQMNKVAIRATDSFINQTTKVIARSLASTLKPASQEVQLAAGKNLLMFVQEGCGPGRLSDIVQAVCPHPDYKLLTMRSIPQVTSFIHDMV